MTDDNSTENPIDEDLAFLLGRVSMFVDRAFAGATLTQNLARDAIQDPDSQFRHLQVDVACDATLAAASFLVDATSDLFKKLELEYPNWDDVHTRLPDPREILSKIEGGAS